MSGAMEKNRRSDRTCHSPWDPRVCGGESLTVSGSGGTIIQRMIATTSAIAPARTKMSRHDMNCNRISIGRVAASAPRPPMAICAPFMTGNRLAGNHITYALKAPIRHADTPRPIRQRPTTSPARLWALAKRNAPVAAIVSSVASVRRGPKRSRSNPSGN